LLAFEKHFLPVGAIKLVRAKNCNKRKLIWCAVACFFSLWFRNNKSAVGKKKENFMPADKLCCSDLIKRKPGAAVFSG